jgi:Mg2+-importing ATPase
MLLVPVGAALVGAILPYTGLAHLLGFTPLPTTFFLLLFGMVVVYLLLVELAKTQFYRAPRARSSRHVTTHAERMERHLRRRASRFIRFVTTDEHNGEEGRGAPPRRDPVGTNGSDG